MQGSPRGRTDESIWIPGGEGTGVREGVSTSALQAVRESGHWEATGGIFKERGKVTVPLL